MNKRSNVFIGVLLVGLGALFLLARIFNLSLIGAFWPFFVIIPGLLFFAGMVAGGKSAGALAIPGSIVTMVGLLLLYQNTFNHFESWAYAWALIMPTSVGIGLMIHGSWSGLDKLVQQGMRFAGVGLAIFFAFGFFFEAIIGISGAGIPGIVWPLALIGLGAYLLTRSDKGEPAESEKVNEFEGIERPPIREPQEDKPTFEPLDMSRGE